MKKILVMILIILTTSIFSADWYSNAERIDVKPRIASKDTLWHGYADSGSGWVMQVPMERATYYQIDDFGVDYPANLHGVDTYLFDIGDEFTYKIYAKDGTTLLWESNVVSSVEGYNEVLLDTPIVMIDDFWLSVAPVSGGYPRQFAQDQAEPSHSYLSDGAGGWDHWTATGGMYYENFNYVYLEPYTDTDIYPPNARTLSGGECFQNFDMNLSLIVHDQNPVVSPMSSRYSLDAGVTWIDFDMISAKGSYTFTGTIPGQIDGTIGLVKFNMNDGINEPSWSQDFDISWSKDLPLFVEDFENETFPPVGWTLNTTGAGWIEATLANGGYTHGGEKAAAHMDDSGTQDDWLITPMISIPADPSATLTFWETVYWTQYMNGMNEIGVSTDGFATHTIVWSEDPTYVATNIIDGDYYFKSATLSAYAGQDIQIGFHYTGDYGCQWYIDDIEVLYDYEAPSITSIMANTALDPVIGAYLNNNMVINLKVYDVTGVDTVVGHYTFDGGVTIVDIAFTQAKGVTENWTATIPAMDVVASGTINFDLTDLGGLSGSTSDYNIEFVQDNAPAVIKYVQGRSVFINEDMNVGVVFTDESAISSCTGYYSKDNFVTSTPFVMTPSKLHEYTYGGTIPAETSETFAEVAFAIEDAEGNITNTNEYEVRWLDGGIVFFDDFDANYDPANWIYPAGTTWARTEETAISPTNSMTESPGGNYDDEVISSLWTKPINLSSAEAAMMYFWAKIDLEAGFDYVYLQATPDNGMTWIEMAVFNGEGGDWEFKTINLGALAHEAAVQFRFYFVSDAYVNNDGMHFDDIRIDSYNQDYSSVIISYGGPDVPVIGTDPYIVTAELDDPSGISESTLIYSVEGGPEQVIISDPVSGASGTYTYTIPAQAPYTKVSFRLTATDNSSYLNYYETDKSWDIMFGNYLYYENGDEYTDFLDIIGSGVTASAYAVAKRITMGPMEAKNHYMADLVGFTIANYVSEEYPSAPIYAHVWANSGAGPSEDLITPIYMEQGSTVEDSYALTWVDLTSYTAELSNLEGDVYVGFTSSGEATNILYEVVSSHTGEPGYTAFKRSWLGIGNDASVEWSLDAASIYHISAITGPYTLVDAPLAPLGVQIRGGEGNIILDWFEGADLDLDNYNIYRGDAAGFALGTPIGNVLATETLTYVDTTCVYGAEYFYKITAVDVGGQESLPSKEVSVFSDGIDGNIPMVTSLSQNYPNPFNPVTTINFSTAVEGNVSLIVYNTAGAVIAKLVDGRMERGYHSVPFDGSRLVSGVYYYTMQLNSKVFTHKMMLLK